MKRNPQAPDEAANCAQQLRAAFSRYADAADIRFRARISSLPRPASSRPTAQAIVRIDLTRADADLLTDLLNAATGRTGTHAPHDPAGSWLGTTDVARQLGVEPGTIRGWISRDGPKGHRFPQPDVRYGRRSYWQDRTVEDWKTEQQRIDAQHRREHHAHPES